MKFDPTIALGSIIHLCILVIVIYSLSFKFIKRLTRLENKQDEILGKFKNNAN